MPNLEKKRKRNREWMRKDRIKNPQRYLSNNCKECGKVCDKRTDICFTCVRKSRKGIMVSEEIKKKISETNKRKGIKPKTAGWNKGIKMKKEWTEKLRLNSKRGELHYRWKGGITPLVMQIRHCFKYRQWRSDVFTRDDYTCVFCGQRGGWLEVDHYPKMFSTIFHENNIKSLEEAFDCEEFWNINNGRTLCKKCHNKTKQGLKAWSCWKSI